MCGYLWTRRGHADLHPGCSSNYIRIPCAENEEYKKVQCRSVEVLPSMHETQLRGLYLFVVQNPARYLADDGKLESAMPSISRCLCR